MLKINKGSVKPIFFELKKIHSSYDELVESEKNKIKEVLLQEQQNRCAYCTCRISLEQSTIEHYIPQSRDRSLSLEYSNMFAVCRVTRDSPRSLQTCDSHRGSTLLHIDPRKQENIDTIYYTHGGRILSVNEDFEYDIDCTLNLNQARLVNNRCAALSSVFERSNRRNNSEWKRDKIKKYIEKLSAQGDDTPYAGFLIYMLKKKLRRSQ